MIDSLFIKVFLIIVVLIFLIGLIIPFIVLKRRGIDAHGIHEGGSTLTRLTPVSIMIWLLYVIFYIIFGNSIIILWSFAIFMFDIIIITGMILIVISLIFNALAMIGLGMNFRLEIPKEETELIMKGIYRLMRNPVVFALYLMLIGSFLIIPNIILMFIVIVNIITFESKIRDEEKFLSKRFEKKYETYRNKVGRYLPFKLKKVKKE